MPKSPLEIHTETFYIKADKGPGIWKRWQSKREYSRSGINEIPTHPHAFAVKVAGTSACSGRGTEAAYSRPKIVESQRAGDWAIKLISDSGTDRSVNARDQLEIQIRHNNDKSNNQASGI